MGFDHACKADGHRRPSNQFWNDCCQPGCDRVLTRRIHQVETLRKELDSSKAATAELESKAEGHSAELRKEKKERQEWQDKANNAQVYFDDDVEHP